MLYCWVNLYQNCWFFQLQNVSAYIYINKMSVLYKWPWVVIIKTYLETPVTVSSSIVDSSKRSRPPMGVALTCDSVSPGFLIGLGSSFASVSIAGGDFGSLGEFTETEACSPLFDSRSFLSCLWAGIKSLVMTTLCHLTGNLGGCVLHYLKGIFDAMYHSRSP